MVNIYRLAPIDARHSSWRHCEERDTVWACARTPQRARDLVTAKTGFAAPDANEIKSPWQDETVTSCVLDSTMSLMDADTVVRQDGSLVDR